MSEQDNNINDEEEEENKPKLLGTRIRLAGDKDNCNICKTGDEFFSENAPKAGARYEYYHIESDKGKEIAENLGSDSKNIPIPAIEYCKEVDEGEGPREVCDYVEGFSKKDWDSKLNYVKRNDVDEELEELFGED